MNPIDAAMVSYPGNIYTSHVGKTAVITLYDVVGGAGSTTKVIVNGSNLTPKLVTTRYITSSTQRDFIVYVFKIPSNPTVNVTTSITQAVVTIYD